ncbi:Tryptophan synthase alpha chain [Thermogutta terrifontis]|uniref:Tryptophan synthase alpha chain n=1 Tax=Thermogutta terrifontis TaxID=1331910 RepID=A0A286RGS8_9BACT|nr:tryptophan synthase subunit alpha [Thermogutta terrifontis]ASV75142.1 Tryptophan synthase alpha chain [Thermogutta terrifontis]
MSAVSTVFQQLRQHGKKALMPFLTAGDPNLEFTEEVIQLLSEEGCALLELGFPYSDPIADGPVIQASYTRALRSGVKVDAVFDTVARVVPKVATPIVGMVSYAIVLRRGLQRFVEAARSSGLAGLIVPDLPVEESSELRAVCDEADLDLIQLITPTTPRPRAIEIAQKSRGFIYYVSVAGITGERSELPATVVENVAWLRQQTDLPICVGFGVSRPEHARMVAQVADGVIVGSAFVRRISEAATRPKEEVLRELQQFARSLLSALDTAPQSLSQRD